ncbi:MAG: proprotein convertase P-domain-containing protein, partial [Bacteroidota bacterium]
MKIFTRANLSAIKSLQKAQIIPRKLLFILFLSFFWLHASAQITYSGSGGNAAAIQPVVDGFRADLGTLNPNVVGSFGSGRREINWDGVPDALAAPNNLTANFFNVNSPRGVILVTPGTGFQVSANSGIAPVRFDNINPTYSSIFQTFSPQRLFTALGSNITDVNFFIAGSGTPAVVRGFGAVFTDVDLASVTSIQFFNTSNVSLGIFSAPLANNGLSFLGVSFPTNVIARVRITSGNAALGAGVNDGPSDLVVMDDFIYGEPSPLVAPCGNIVSYTGPAVPIPDNTPAGVNIPLTVSGVGTVADLNFRFDPGAATCDATPGNTNAAVDHTFLADLVFKLTSPLGTTVTIVNHRGGAGNNICNLLLDDDGGFPAISTLPATGGVSGNFAPENPLSAFDGQNPNGVWILNVSDNTAADVGSLRRFSLIFNGLSISNVAVVQPTCTVPTGTITVNASSTCSIEYSVNGAAGPFQASNAFAGLTPGSYNVRIREQANPGNFIDYSGNPVIINSPAASLVVSYTGPAVPIPDNTPAGV